MELTKNTHISDSLCGYLEAIYDISMEKECVRTTDIALRLGISKPSVNKAVGALKAKGYVTHVPYGSVSLTDKGLALGEYSGRKSLTIKKFLTDILNIPDADAETEACSIGKAVSFSTVEKMMSYMRNAS